MAKSSASDRTGVKDSSEKHKPVAFKVKKAKYGWHAGKNLSKTECY